MQQIHDKRGANPNNFRLDILNLTCDHCDGLINKSLVADISVGIDKIIQNENELNKSDSKWDS